MPTEEEVWQQVSRLIASTQSFARRASLIVVANSKTGTMDEVDYQETSLSTEYFSSTELSQLLSGFRKHGFFVTYYGSELDFIGADLRGEVDRSGRHLQIVYNTAQSGIGAGRKALVPAYCARRGIKVCNSDAYVVSLVRHKFHVHCILKRLGLPTAETWLFHPTTGWIGGQPTAGPKLIAKAAFESASIGLTPDCIGTLSPPFEQLLRRKCSTYAQPFVVQQLIEGYEVEVPLLQLDKMRAIDAVSITLSGEVNLREQILNYDIINSDNYGFTPSDHVSAVLIQKIRTAAESAAETLGIRGIGRVDFRIDSKGRFFITDVSTSPHLVRHSSAAHTFKWHGHSHADLLAAMIGANARLWHITQDSDHT